MARSGLRATGRFVGGQEVRASCSQASKACKCELQVRSCWLGGPLKPFRGSFASTFEPQRLLELRPARCRIKRASKCRLRSRNKACRRHRTGNWNTLPGESRIDLHSPSWQELHRKGSFDGIDGIDGALPSFLAGTV